MEFNRLLSQAISFYGEGDTKAVTKNKNEKVDIKKYNCIKTEKQLNDWIQELEKEAVISFDTETTSLNPLEAV